MPIRLQNVHLVPIKLWPLQFSIHLNFNSSNEYVSIQSFNTIYICVSGTERTWGVFGWDLLFDWDVIAPREELRRQDNPAMPIRTPAMAGGLFLIRRDYFYDVSKSYCVNSISF